jgi:hypothetical protein
VVIGVAFSLYFAVRSAVVGRPEIAYANAVDIIGLQRRLGLFWEDDMNAWVSQRLFWAQAANLVYFWLLFPVMIIFALWLYHSRRHKYTFIRDTFLASGAIGLVIFWAYPVAPPRELPALAARFDPQAPGYVLGFVDTLKLYLRYAHDSGSTGLWVNPYAAMPCLHVGWNLLMGSADMVGLARALDMDRDADRRGIARHAVAGRDGHGQSLPSLDLAAGVVVSLLAFPVALALQRWGYPALERALRRVPAWPSWPGRAKVHQARQKSDG